MHVGQRVDAERAVPERDRAPEEADEQAGPAGEQPAADAQQDRDQVGVAVEPDQLREFGEVGARAS